MSWEGMPCPKTNCDGKLKAVGERTGGFSGGKAVAGGLLLGPIGLAAGALGKKKYTYVCDKCGYMVEKNS